MPGRMYRVKGGWRVRWGGKIVAKRTSKKKGRRQLRLLRDRERGKR